MGRKASLERQREHRSPRIGARLVTVSLGAVAATGGPASGWSAVPPPGFTVAFFGDQGLGADAVAVLELVATEGADAVVHSGDFDYSNDPDAWDAQISSVLGGCFPYFASAGNHDDGASYYGPGGYQEKLAARMDCLGIPWDGDLGVRSSHTYLGVFFVFTSPALFGADGDAVHAPYIRDQFLHSDAIWRISSWHVLMEAMQVGGKYDQSGWGVYEESRRGGAVIATAHEHSYGRTHALRNCEAREVASFESTFSIHRDDPGTTTDEGVTFVHHNGLGGMSIRDQERCFPTQPPYGCDGEWASIYATQQSALHGALFGVFNHGGDPCRARFYFKDIAGKVIDEFFVDSTLGFCPCPMDYNGDGSVNVADFLLLLAGFWNQQPDLDRDGDGLLNVTELLMMLGAWGDCLE